MVLHAGGELPNEARAYVSVLNERRYDLCHEPGHFIFDLRMRLQTDVEIEDDLVDSRGFHLLQHIDDM